MHNKFEQDTWKILKSSPCLQGQIVDVKYEKSIGHFDFFQPILNLSENWLLVTCITYLSRIHEELFKLSCPQANVHTDANANRNADAEIQLQ